MKILFKLSCLTNLLVGVLCAAVFLNGCAPDTITKKDTRTSKDTRVTKKSDSFARMESTSHKGHTALATLTVVNANSFSLQQEPLYFSFYDLGLVSTDPRVKNLNFLENNIPQPSQLIDVNGDGELDGLLVALNFLPTEKKQFVLTSDSSIKKPIIKKQTQAEISIKEGGEWKGKEYVGGVFKNVDHLTPPSQYTDHSFYIRYEGPGIESDKVAYRVYLDWRNGFDIFGKVKSDMALQKIGLDGYDSYHNLLEWGQDIFKVGKSLGAGGFGFWNGKNVELVSKVDTHDAIITNNGDIYSSFKINYNGWQINDKKLNLVANLSMTAGSRLVKVKLNASESLPNLTIGLVKHPNTKFLEGDQNISGSAWAYAASWGKQSLSGDNDYLGIAVLFRRDDRASQVQDENNYASVMKAKGGEVEYYFLAAWDHEPNGIKTEEEFKQYLDREVERLTKTPRVNFETTLSEQAKKKALTAEAALGWSKALADSELERKTLRYAYQGWDEHRKQTGRFDYDVTGMQIQALNELDKLSPDPKYFTAMEKVTGSYISEQGEIFTYNPELFSIDQTKPGQVVILLEQKTHQEKYRKAADYLRERLKLHPRTSEGAFWHRTVYPNQLWLDGVYMGMPFLAQYAAAYETGKQQHESFEEAVHEFEVARKHLRDEKTGLYFHAWDESKQAAWANQTTGTASQFWSRGMGWYAMALVDVLDFIPPNEIELRARLLKIINEFTPSIVSYQDKATRTWWQITDKANAVGNYRESTASAMFTYFLAKAVNRGYIDQRYKSDALVSYQGLVSQFIRVHADGKISMTNQCLVAGLGFGRDGSYDYYMTEPIVSNDAKGNTPFILAGLEISKMLSH